MPNVTDPGRASLVNTVVLTGRHDGAAGAATSFMAQGDATTSPIAYPNGFAIQFPSPKATTLRVRAWVNSLAQPLTVTLMKNGVPALNAAGAEVSVTIAAGSLDTAANFSDVIDYAPGDTYDVRLTSTAGGAGNSALVAVCLDTAPSQSIANRGLASNIVTLTGLHNGSAGNSTPWMQPGDVLTAPGAFATTFRQRFPAAKAMSFRARAWTNTLAANLHVELRRRSPAQAAANTSSIVVDLVIPPGSLAQVIETKLVPSYDIREVDATGQLISDGSYDVRLTSNGAGVGNSARVAVCIDAVQ